MFVMSDDGYCEKILSTVFINPEVFGHLDKNGLILDSYEILGDAEFNLK